MQDSLSMEQKKDGKKSSSAAGKVFLWGLLLSVALGGGWYWWLEKQPDLPPILQSGPSAFGPSVSASADSAPKNATPSMENTPPVVVPPTAPTAVETTPPPDAKKTEQPKEQAAKEQGKDQGAEERRQIDNSKTPSAQSGRQDDTVVKIAFIEDVAKWLVEGYRPSAGKGRVQIELQQANMRYGVGLKGLAWHGDNPHSGRSDVLRYMFTPGMLSGLYKLYGDRFMEDMKNAAQKKHLTAAQQSDMFVQYAKKFKTLSGTLTGITNLPDLSRRLAALQSASQNVMTTEARYGELVFAQEQAREKGQIEKSSEMQGRIEFAARNYQRAVLECEQVRRTLVSAVKNNPEARALDDDATLFVARWVERRTNKQTSGSKAVKQASFILEDLAKRFEEAAKP